MSINNHNLNILQLFSIINLQEIFSILTIIEAKIKNHDYFRKLKNEYKEKYIKNCYLTKEDYMNIEFWYEIDHRVNSKDSKNFI
jgi:hypothetical protein